MPRRFPGILVAGAAAILAVALSVLYVIRSSPVHETPPPALAALIPEPAPKPLPATAFMDAQGRTRSLAAFRGHVVILNLWATWCAPCVRELPALGRLAEALGPGKVIIVAVNAGHDDAAATARFLKAHGAADLAGYRDPELSLLAAFGSQGLPFSVLIDARGREIARASGPMGWDDPAAVAYFKSLGAHAAS
jgi:thiol-disulfide isomerase/thioredoxin